MKRIADDIKFYEGEGFSGFGPLGFEGSDPWSSFSTFNKFLSMSVGVITAIAAIWLVFKIITGALGIVSSSGDKNKLTSAWASITYGVIGFVIVITGIFILDLFGKILGIRILDGMSVFLEAKYNPLL